MSYPPPYDPNQPPPPAQSPVQPAQPVVKSKATPVIIIVLVVLLVICAGCVGGGWYFYNKAADKVEEIKDQLPSFNPEAPGNNDNSVTEHTIKYELTGSGSVQVSYISPDSAGGKVTEDIDLPWSKEIVIKKKSFGASLTAIRMSDKDAQLDGCSILVDGAKKSAQTKSEAGIYCVAMVL